jgi:hypothetical protein
MRIHTNIDSEDNSIDDSVYDSTDNSIVESSTLSIVESAPPTVESQLEFELNQFFNDNNDISMWLEQQGVHGVQEIQGVQDQGVQDRRYPLRQRRPTATAATVEPGYKDPHAYGYLTFKDTTSGPAYF